MKLDTSTPVLLLGGKENALSITRHLGQLGIKVRVSGNQSCWAMWSRFCAESFPVPFRSDAQEYWRKLLLGNDGRLNGHILWALSDDAIEFLNTHRSGLAARYTLDEADPQLQRDFLDKIATLEIAERAGVGAPRHWRLADESQLAPMRSRITFPAMVKPVHSHKFTRVFRRKLFIIESDFDELEAKLRMCWAHGLEVFVVEMIPGPDSLLSSYYTYRTKSGQRLFDFTKSIIRRWPVNRGNACHHTAGWLPETAEAGRRFFEAAGLRGLGNIEFKRDPRDGKLKVIEVNARFTAAQELVRRSGVPIDLVIYCHLTRQPVPSVSQDERGLRLWYPVRDVLGFLELRRRGELSFRSWLASVMKPGAVLPLASLLDPLPMLGATIALAYKLMG